MRSRALRSGLLQLRTEAAFRIREDEMKLREFALLTMCLQGESILQQERNIALTCGVLDSGGYVALI